MSSTLTSYTSETLTTITTTNQGGKATTISPVLVVGTSTLKINPSSGPGQIGTGVPSLIPSSSLTANSSIVLPSSNPLGAASSTTTSDNEHGKPRRNGTNSIIEKSSGVSPGGVAGAAIGCLLAGLLIGALAVFLFMKRRNDKRSHYRGDYAPPVTAVPPVAPEKAMPLVTANTFDADSAAAIVENTLPQPEEDQTILNEMVKLQNSIKNHVSSFYEKGHVPPIDGNLEAYDYLGGDLPLSASSLSALLQNPGTRVAAIRFCIAWAALYRAGFYCSLADSSLPPGVTAVMANMSGIENNPRAQEAFTSKWRTITAALMSKTFSRTHISHSDPRMPPITHTLQILDDVIGPYAVGRDPNNSRRKNLEEILKRAASFAFLLFSQPTSWQFAWDDTSNQSGSLVIFPALLQTGDEEGRPIRPPRVSGQVEVVPAVEWRA